MRTVAAAPSGVFERKLGARVDNEATPFGGDRERQRLVGDGQGSSSCRRGEFAFGPRTWLVRVRWVVGGNTARTRLSESTEADGGYRFCHSHARATRNHQACDEPNFEMFSAAAAIASVTAETRQRS